MASITTHEADTGYLTLNEAVRRLPSGRNGTRTHVSTLTRWILSGVVARDGSRIKLRAVRLPGRWMLPAGALEEFLERVTSDRIGPPAAPPAEADRRAAAHAERVDRQLDAIGI
jgi:hypothetical protein